MLEARGQVSSLLGVGAVNQRLDVSYSGRGTIYAAGCRLKV